MRSSKKSFTYREFRNYVCRYNPSSVVEEVSRISSMVTEDPRRLVGQAVFPWSLAAVVRAAVLHGKTYRTQRITASEVEYACAMFNHVHEEELDRPGQAFLFNTFARISFEQFPYQESYFEELTRAHAMFDGYSGRTNLNVITPNSLELLLGAPVAQVFGTAMLLWAAVRTFGGVFDISCLEDSDLDERLKDLPKETILSVIETVFATDIDGFRGFANKAAGKLPSLRENRYSFNPLSARPLLRIGEGRYIAPVPALILRKVAPLEHYYSGLDLWDVGFTKDLGEIFEDYIGRQFQEIRGAVVHPEIEYGSKKDGVKKTVDWIVELPELVLLVEAKATRVPELARSTPETVESYKKTLGRAVSQINKTHKALQEDHPELRDIPRDKPFWGIVTTLDSWYSANTFPREYLPVSDVPLTFASAREIEALVTVGQSHSVDKVLANIAQQGKQDWNLAVALAEYRQGADVKNPLLLRSWKELAIFGDRDWD